MKLTFQNSTGLSINVQPARFELVRARIDGNAGEPELAPTAWAGSSLMECIGQVGSVATSSALLRLDNCSMGVLYASAGGNLAALLFDLAEPEIQAWLSRAKRTGNLPVVFQCSQSTKLVRIPLDADIVDLVDRASECVRATPDELVMAMQAVVGQFDDSDLMARWGINLADLTHGSVSLLTPTASLGGINSTRH